MKKRTILSVFLLICIGAVAQDASVRYLNYQERSFEENKGQVADSDGNVQQDILYTLKDKNVTVYFRKHGLSYQWNVFSKLMPPPSAVSEATGSSTQSSRNTDINNEIVESFRVDMVWNGANDHVNITAGGPIDGITNYYLGHCREGVRGVRSFRKLVYKDLYPGIDIEYYINENGNLKYDIYLQGGADPSLLSYSFVGAVPQIVNGRLRINSPLGFVEEQVPVAWLANAVEQKVDAQYRHSRDGIGFELSRMDKPVVVDPEIIWSTYYGGTSTDEGNATTVDELGNVFLAGRSNSTTIAASPGCQTTNFNLDAFLAKFNSDGNTRLWATYYGGSGTESANAITIDPQGAVYLAGTTNSTNLPGVTYITVKIGNASETAAFLSKFSNGGQCLWATYYGGDNTSGRSVATDAAGNVYLAGDTHQIIMDIENAPAGHDRSYSNPQISFNPDAFLVKFNSSGTTRLWATYYGGEYDEFGYAVAVDQQNNVYLAGSTSTAVGDQHADISTSGAFQAIQGGGTDAFIVKFSETGNRIWGTYFGGTGTDEIRSIDLDMAGNLYVGGNTNSSSGLATAGAFQTVKGLYYDAFVAKFTSSGSRLWASYFGGNGGTSDIKGGDELYSITLDNNSNIFLAGRTNSPGLSLNGFQNTISTNFDAFVAMVKSEGDALRWSSYFGGVNNDFGHSVAVNSTGIYMAGSTATTTLSTPGTVQPVYGGPGSDAFLVKIAVPDIISTSFPEVAVKTGGTPVGVTFNYSTNSTVRFWSKGISQPASAWKNELVTSTNTTFTKNLSSSDLSDPIGLTFFFELTDNSQAVIRSDTASLHLRHAAGENQFPGLRFGNQVSDYQIVATPLLPDNAAVTSVLDELGAYDKKKWRLFRYYENDNREYPAFSTIEPGIGYWLIVRNSVSIDPGQGVTVPATEKNPFNITLNTGWNLIGNPYDFRISWQDVLDHNGNPGGVGSLRVFSNGALGESNVLDRYRGGFVFSDANTTLKVPVLRNTSLGSRVRSPKIRNALNEAYWEVPLLVSHHDLVNELAGIGMHPDAALNGKDQFDEVSIPLLEGMGFFELYVNHPEVNASFSKDFVPTASEHTWHISVRRDSSHPIKLSWDNSYFGSNEQQLYLFNPYTKQVTNMRETSHVTIGEETKQVWVIYGEQAYIDAVLDTGLFGLGDPYPVPSDARIHIPVWVPKSETHCQVAIDIFDSMGRHVSTVADIGLPAGLHTFEWDSRNSGLYVVRMRLGGVTQSRKVIIR
jgi:hypothetical protein